MKKGKTDKLYNVVHYASSKPNAAKLETIQFNVPITLAKYLKRKHRNTTHRMGVIKIEPN